MKVITFVKKMNSLLIELIAFACSHVKVFGLKQCQWLIIGSLLES